MAKIPRHRVPMPKRSGNANHGSMGKLSKPLQADDECDRLTLAVSRVQVSTAARASR